MFVTFPFFFFARFLRERTRRRTRNSFDLPFFLFVSLFFLFFFFRKFIELVRPRFYRRACFTFPRVNISESSLLNSLQIPLTATAIREHLSLPIIAECGNALNLRHQPPLPHGAINISKREQATCNPSPIRFKLFRAISQYYLELSNLSSLGNLIRSNSLYCLDATIKM